MSTKTSNYQLHQWEPNDQFLREDFNTDFAKIDAGIKHAYDHAGEVESNLTAQLTSTRNTLNTAIGKKADQTALTALQNVVNGKLEVVVGSYTGKGENTKTIHLGFQPKAVFLITDDGTTDNAGATFGGLFAPGLPLGGSSAYATVTATGFTLNGSSCYVTKNNKTYYYFCLK